MRFIDRVPVSAKYTSSIYLTGILFFTFFRCLFIYLNAAALNGIPGVGDILLHTFLNGLRFDIVISGYVLILPLTMLLITELFGFLRSSLLLGIHLLICTSYTVAFFI